MICDTCGEEMVSMAIDYDWCQSCGTLHLYGKGWQVPEERLQQCRDYAIRCQQALKKETST